MTSYHRLMAEAKQEFDAWDPIMSMSCRACVRCAAEIKSSSPFFQRGVCKDCTSKERKAVQLAVEKPPAALKVDTNKYKKRCACGRRYYRQGKCYRCFMLHRRQQEGST